MMMFLAAAAVAQYQILFFDRAGHIARKDVLPFASPPAAIESDITAHLSPEIGRVLIVRWSDGSFFAIGAVKDPPK